MRTRSALQRLCTRSLTCFRSWFCRLVSLISLPTFGLGLLDWFGGCFVGIIVTAIIVLIRRKGWSRWLMILPIILVPGLGVPSYLSYLLHVPYSVLATSLCIGQSVPAVCGVVLVNVLQRALYPKATKA